MPKNLFQDMVKAKTARKEISKKKFQVKAPELRTYQHPEMMPTRSTSGKKSHLGVWLVAVISIIFFIFALSFLFSKAQIIVNPKTTDIALNANLSAVKDLNTAGLAFDLVILSGEETRQVKAGEEREISTSSKGAIFIYNTSSTPQKLSINTRLEGSNGKIYKTSKEVDVPGISADGAPGKTQVDIYGAEPGEAYNSDPLDFKIFGFKGTPKYETFYGRSVGKITGGFKGKSPFISDEEKEKVMDELEIALKQKLLQKITDQIPAGFVLFKDAVFLRIDEENVGFNSSNSDLPLTIKGTLYGFLLTEKSLIQKIAEDNLANYDSETRVDIPNIQDLKFSLTDPNISFNEVQNISFSLSGNAKIVWVFDDASFKKSLLGKSKKDFNQILSEYPNVESAELTLSPFWVRSLPSNLEDIKIIVNYPK